jgi:NRPS condensation-like uncharacterized protein
MTTPAFERKVSPLERFFRRSPYSIVTMVVRIKGEVTEAMLRSAVSQVRARHPSLRVRIREDSDRVPWFTPEGAGEIPVDVAPRTSGGRWIEVHRAACRIPFDSDRRPAVRFLLVRSGTESELIILCQHSICDGLSLAYLARDIMVWLGNPAQRADALPDPAPIDRDNLPRGVSMNAVIKFFINRINRQWEKDKIYFDQKDYEAIHQAYWANVDQRMVVVELTEDQTSALVDRCRKEGVTVTSALTAAFVGAQLRVQGDKSFHSSVYMAASLRDRLPKPAGEVMGFYAGATTLKFAYDGKSGFWENARRFHKQVGPLYTNQNLFGDLLSWCYLEPAVLEAIHFKKLGSLVDPGHPSHEKLSAYANRNDVVSSILRREKQEKLDRIFMGTAVTNLTRMDFPRCYGTLELDRLILHPGGGFPLSNVNLVLGVVTCSGKLSLVVEYVEQAVDTATVIKVKDAAVAWLLEKE